MSKVLPSQVIQTLIENGTIRAEVSITPEQIQPASLDLRLSNIAYRVAASSLPERDCGTVEDRIKQLAMHQLDLSHGAVLEKGCVYIIPLQESVNLPHTMRGRANPKSSTGRLDVFARVIVDGTDEFDSLKQGFCGKIYCEISPRTFSIRAYEGDRLVQLRLFDENNEPAQETEKKITPFTVDVSGEAAPWLPHFGDFPPIIGWRARKHAGLIDLRQIGKHRILDYWEPVFANRFQNEQGGVILDPDDFYIFATQETVSIPPNYAAEMLAYNTALGEFRVHYAGFFDPGFGYEQAGGADSRAVLEVRTHEVPFFIAEKQIVGNLVYEEMFAVPDKLYGKEMASNYQGQGLKLAKYFQQKL
jgi:dCTP deaminase